MPVYYFAESGSADDLHLHDEGLEFANNADARDGGERALREMAASDKGETIWMSVFDEERKLLHRTRLDVTHVPAAT